MERGDAWWRSGGHRRAPLAAGLAAAAVLGLALGAVRKPDRWGQPGDGVVLPAGPWVQTASDVSLEGNRLCARLRRPDGRWGDRGCVFAQPGHTFENLGGELRVERPPELPGGTWVESSRNVRREGNLLYAELLRSNLTWNRVAIVVGEHHYYKNVDGELWRQNSGCLSLGACLTGYTLKAGAFLIYCEGLACDPRVDLERCCEEAMPCSTVDFCVPPRVVDEEEYCDGTTCDELRDYNTCCVSRARCSSLECPRGYMHVPGAYHLFCSRFVCSLELELDLCCQPQAPCYELQDQTCDEGSYFNPAEFCGDTSCDEDLDRDRCCPPAMPCEEYSCPLSYTPRQNMSAVFCAGPTCVPRRDTDACCELAMPCENISDLCAFGFATEDDTYCDGVSCLPERDIPICCQAAELCTGLNHTNCTLGYFFNYTDYCDGGQCEEDRDRDKCCQAAEPCSHFECPYGQARRDNPLVWMEVGDPPEMQQMESIYCDGLVCDSVRDLPICCLVRAPCLSYECPAGWIHTWNASVELCAGDECNTEDDRDTCCDPRGVCEEEYTCPHGNVPKPAPVWCNGVTCEPARDLSHCCDPAMPCTNLTCPENYVQRPDSYCSKAKHLPNACTMEVDKDVCCLRGMAMEFYRFHPLTARHYQSYQVQLSEFNLFFYGELVVGSKQNLEFPERGATAFSPGGNYPARESPDKAIDEDTDTKWLDEDPDPRKWRFGQTYVWKPLVVRLPTAGPIDAYSFHTANDIPDRDPISWRVEGSPDNQTWVELHYAEDGLTSVPEDRQTETPRWPIEVPCFLPLPVHILHSLSPFPCAEGDLTRNGGNCTAQCQPGYQPDPPVLTCMGGELEPRSFVCIAS